MISHLTVAVSNFEKSCEFYDKTLASLGYERCFASEHEDHVSAGWGKNGNPEFIIMGKTLLSEKDKSEQIGQALGFHVCFSAPSHEAVKNWHSLCCSNGGADNGKPGPRPEYPPTFTTAYVVDPDGWRLEALCMA